MINYCILCRKKHDALNWRFASLSNVEEVKWGWFCDKWFKPPQHEWVPQRIKEDRKKFSKDILQPYRAGEASREFIEAYPERAKKTFTKKELRNAKNVWK
jgi:hypothetical protein